MWKEFDVVEMAEVVGLMSFMPRCLKLALYHIPEEKTLGSVFYLSDLVQACEIGERNYQITQVESVIGKSPQWLQWGE